MSNQYFQNRIEFDKYINDNFMVDESFYEGYIYNFSGDYYYLLMYSYFLINQGKLDKFEKVFSKIVISDIQDNYSLSLYYMIEACYSTFKNRNLEAEKKFNLALELDDEKKNKHLRLELYFYYFKCMNDYVAFSYLQDSIKIDPHFNKAIVEECKTLDEEYNCDLIIEKLKNVPKTYNDPDLYQILGVAYFNKGSVPKAIKLLENSIAINSDVMNNFSLGYIYDNELEKFNLAEKFYLKSLNQDPNNLDALNAYAWLLYKLDKFEEAEKMFIKQLNLSNEQTNFDQIIQFYLHTNSLKKASKKIEESNLINGESFTNAGFNIILLMRKKVPYQQLVDQYKKKYNEFEIQWLKEQISCYLN